MSLSYLRGLPLLSLLLLPACDDAPTLPETEALVVRAFLYSGALVEDVQLTLAVPLGAEDTTQIPVTDAAVALIAGDAVFPLEPDPARPGYYRDSSGLVVVEPGQRWRLEVAHPVGLLSAETSVPERPSIITQSDSLLAVSDALPTPGFGGGVDPGGGITVRWANPSTELYFAVVDNREADPQPLPTSGFRPPVRFVSQPTPADSFRISARQLTHYGEHAVLVYRVNEEYAALYASRNQDSRDLNEPATNIRGGLGIFSAFSSDSVRFRVVPE
jgi:hypothetical protein